MGPKWHCGCGSSAIPEAGSAQLLKTKSEVRGDQQDKKKGRREGILQLEVPGMNTRFSANPS